MFLIFAVAGCGQPQRESQFEVASSSMAPAILGPTREAKCNHCRYRFAVAAETYDQNLPTRCRNCGGDCTVAERQKPGEVVAIARLAKTSKADTPNVEPHSQPLIRFAIVAFQAPDGSTQLKRVWGLPGESIRFVDGEMFVNGQLLQKSLDELKSIGVPVSSFRVSEAGQSQSNLRSHWTVILDEQTDWLEDYYQSTLEAARGYDAKLARDRAVSVPQRASLRWQFLRPAPVHLDVTQPKDWLAAGTLVDEYGMNQGIRRTLHSVGDFYLSIQLAEPLSGDLRLRCDMGGRVINLTFASQNLGDAQQSPNSFLAQQQMEMAVCDGRLLVRTDSFAGTCQISLEEMLVAEKSFIDRDVSSISIDSDSGFKLLELKLLRDLYLDDGLHFAATNFTATSNTVAEDSSGYFLLGDNLPVSIDSRRQLGRIALTKILGQVVRER